jgi:hypothetical protein
MMRIAVVSLLVCLLAVAPARAWNATGHKLICSLAFRQLTQQEQARLVDILKRHPRFTPDFTDAMPPEVRGDGESAQHEWLFQQAGVWPDIVRSGPPERKAFHRFTWHFIDGPHFLDDPARARFEDKLHGNRALDPPAAATPQTQELNVIQAIRLARKLVSDQQANPEDRAVLLAWLCHNVGDIHQPCHSTSLFSRRLLPEGDQGGNKIKVTQSFSLHVLWDNFPGSNEQYREVRNRAIALAADAGLSEVGQAAAANLDERAWRDESHVLALGAVYDPEILLALRKQEALTGPLEPLTLSEEYLKMGGRISQRRIVQAGYRLAAVLKAAATE